MIPWGNVNVTVNAQCNELLYCTSLYSVGSGTMGELIWVTESGCVWLSSSFVTYVFVLLTGVNKPTVSTELTMHQ